MSGSLPHGSLWLPGTHIQVMAIYSQAWWVRHLCLVGRVSGPGAGGLPPCTAVFTPCTEELESYWERDLKVLLLPLYFSQNCTSEWLGTLVTEEPLSFHRLW